MSTGIVLILPDQLWGYIGKHTEVTKHRHNGSYLKNSNMQLRDTISTEISADQLVHVELDNCIQLH